MPYLETLTDWIAVSCARASRASIGAKLTLPPRRRLTIIPASVGRVLATPWAWGRISVTVDLAITRWIKQRLCQPEPANRIRHLREWRILRTAQW